MATRYDQARVVAVQLGLGENAQEAEDLAARHWPGWVAAAPELGVVPGGAAGLIGWLRSAPPEQADQVLGGLARLGAVDGEDDRAAALTVAWALLPGACSLAGRLSGLSDRIGEQVAAQLWVEVRTFPWQRLSKVSANVLMNTRAGVLRECGVGSQVEREDRTWARTSVLDPSSATAWTATVDGVDPVHGDEGLSTREELLDLLDWACDNDVIGPQDRRLLLSLTQMADQDDLTGRVCRRGGLLRNDLVERAGQVWGVGSATIRRRATRSIQALSDAAGSYTAGSYTAASYPAASYTRTGPGSSSSFDGSTRGASSRAPYTNQSPYSSQAPYSSGVPA